jgi:hypothetical protein
VERETRKRRPSLRCLKKILREMGCVEGDTNYSAGLVLLAPLATSTMEPNTVSRFTSVPLVLVELFAGRLRENGISTERGKVNIEGDNPEELAVGLALSVGVALGHFERIEVRAGDGDRSGGEVAAGVGCENELLG